MDDEFANDPSELVYFEAPASIVAEYPPPATARFVFPALRTTNGRLYMEALTRDGFACMIGWPQCSDPPSPCPGAAAPQPLYRLSLARPQAKRCPRFGRFLYPPKSVWGCTDGLLVNCGTHRVRYDWLPANWDISCAPNGVLAAQVTAWFETAIACAGADHWRQRPQEEHGTQFYPAPRRWVTHGFLLARALGVADLPAEPITPLTPTGCVALLRNLALACQRHQTHAESAPVPLVPPIAAPTDEPDGPFTHGFFRYHGQRLDLSRANNQWRLIDCLWSAFVNAGQSLPISVEIETVLDHVYGHNYDTQGGDAALKQVARSLRDKLAQRSIPLTIRFNSGHVTLQVVEQ